MSLIISERASYLPAPEGIHVAVCTGVIDLGVQPTNYGNKSQILLVWELDAQMDDGRPFCLSRRFSPSLSKQATLRSFLESWRGRAFTAEELKGFSMRNLLGKACQLMIQHAPSADRSRIYANITAIMPAPKGTSITPAADLLFFDQDDPDPTAFDRLPEWIRKTVSAAIPPQPPTEGNFSAEPERIFNDELAF